VSARLSAVLRQAFALALTSAAILVNSGCDNLSPAPRWVLCSYVTGVWVPINEYRTLVECNQFTSAVTSPQRCMPFGVVPTQPPPAPASR
jgi:hypothetical protein